MSSHAIGGRRNSVMRTVLVAAAGIAFSVAAALPAGADVDPATAIPIAGLMSDSTGGVDSAPASDNTNAGTRVGNNTDAGTRVGDSTDAGTRVGDNTDAGTRVG